MLCSAHLVESRVKQNEQQQEQDEVKVYVYIYTLNGY